VRREVALLRGMRVRAEEVAERRGSMMRSLRATWRQASEDAARADAGHR
jgi:hypothetical protein